MKKVTSIFTVILITLVLFSTVWAAPKVNLRYALWDTNQLPAMEASIKEFMKQNPNIEVTIELTEWNDYWTKMTTGVAARTLPDVFWGHLAYFSGLVSKGALLDLTPISKKDKLDLSIYYQSLLENWKYQGKQYGIPKDGIRFALCITKMLLIKQEFLIPAPIGVGTRGTAGSSSKFYRIDD